MKRKVLTSITTQTHSSILEIYKDILSSHKIKNAFYIDRSWDKERALVICMGISIVYKFKLVMLK